MYCLCNYSGVCESVIYFEKNKIKSYIRKGFARRQEDGPSGDDMIHSVLLLQL